MALKKREFTPESGNVDTYVNGIATNQLRPLSMDVVFSNTGQLIFTIAFTTLPNGCSVF